MKANVFVYLTNGNVVRFNVECPEVGVCNQGNQVGIFDHKAYRIAIDDYDEWYEDVAIYWTTEVVCIYANNKCVWYNQAYIKGTNNIIAEPAKPVEQDDYYMELPF